MKHYRFLPIFVTVILTFAPHSYAQTINQDYLIEAQNAQHKCASDDYLSRYYDCECVGGHIYQLRSTPRNKKLPFSELYAKSLKDCQNLAGIADIKYKQCIESRQNTHKNYEEFCQCFAGSYATNFEKAGLHLYTANSHINKRAMSECHKFTREKPKPNPLFNQ